MHPSTNLGPPSAVGIGASPEPESRSRILLDLALERLERRGVRFERVVLRELAAAALLGRGRDAAVDRALAAVAAADVLVVATPIYRATYSGLLKVFFDLLPHGALAGAVALPIATGGSPGHLLAIDHGLRPLLASAGALVAATGVYATPEDFDGFTPGRPLLERLERAVDEAVSLSARAASELGPAAAPRRSSRVIPRVPVASNPPVRKAASR